MRVLHLVNTLAYGGLERVVTDLAIEQSRHGHEVAVFSLQSTEGLAGELQRQGVAVEIGHKGGGADLRLLLALRRQVRQRGIEVIHAHNAVPNYYAAAACLGLWRRPALVGTSHDMGTRLSDTTLRRRYRWSVGRSERVAMVGAQVHAHFVAAGHVPADRAVTVLNGIPMARFGSSPERRAAARTALGLDDADRVIGCVGRHVALKNHRLMIQAMPALLAVHPRARLVLLGDGELRAELEALARSTGVAAEVRFPGERPNVADLLPAFDIFALPSSTEGLSIALLEACATGLAIVASRVGGNPEIVVDGERGLLVPANDAPALQGALLRLLDDPALGWRLGEAARGWVERHASIEAMRRAYDAVYQDALSQRGSR